MRRTGILHISTGLWALLLSSCNPGRIEIELPDIHVETDLSTISAVCAVDTRVPTGATKAMEEWATIDQITTRKMEANFLRIDEETNTIDNTGTYRFWHSEPFRTGGTANSVNWEKAYLSEAQVISSPDNTEGIHYRSLIFSPRQVYKVLSRVNPENSELSDTTNFYHTRMVGWYPKNCDIPRDGDGKPVTMQFENASGQSETHTIGDRTYKAVKFTGLNGAKDVMMSNVCEGQHWHSDDPHNSEFTDQNGNAPYRVPFGHYQSYSDGNDEFSTRYSNFFKFRHYLSGVRIWGFVPEQNSHALDMWGNITDVVLLDQPTSVCITIPEEVEYDSNGNSLSWDDSNAHPFSDPEYWGQAYDWGDPANFSVQTGPMFGDDTNHSDENFTVDFSHLEMTGVGDKEHALYLGYSLVQPDHSVKVQIHTKYGVYVTTINPQYTYKYKDEHGVEQTETIDLFKAGFYYDVYLSLQTDGTISAIIETRGDGKYYDLTRSVIVSAMGNAQGEVTSYKYANSYIVDPKDATYDLNEDGKCDYQGFFFSGMIAGNGKAGILNYNSQTFFPASERLGNPVKARLIWESSRSLVTNVELINGYVKFKVPGITSSYDKDGNYTGEKGNAVIGVFNDSDVCLWSWHIWITDKPKELTYTDSGGNKVYVMDRNLGALFGGTPNNAGDALKSYGLYYQWGRKDPSMGPPSYNYTQQDGATAVYYDYASDEVDSAVPMFLERPSLRDGVENPMNLILPSKLSDKGYTLDWLYYEPENILWGHDNSTGKTSKTIYDPCPFGYRVPAGELSALMDAGSYVKKTYGLEYNSGISGGSTTLFFPFAGYKGVDKSLSALTTSWKYVGQKGDYQEGFYNTSTTENMLYYRKRTLISSGTSWKEGRVLGKKDYTYGNGTYITAVNGSNVFSDWANRRTATSVRCVRDTDL